MVAVRKGELYEATVRRRIANFRRKTSSTSQWSDCARIGIQDVEEFQFMRDADVLQEPQQKFVAVKKMFEKRCLYRRSIQLRRVVVAVWYQYNASV